MVRSIMPGVTVDGLYERYLEEYRLFAVDEVCMYRLMRDQVEDVDRIAVDRPLAELKPRFYGVIRQETAELERGFRAAFGVLLDALEDETPAIDSFDGFLDRHPFYDGVEESQRGQFRQELQRTYLRAARALQPLADGDDVWSVVREQWSFDGAHHRLMRWFDVMAGPGMATTVSLTVDTTSVSFLPFDTVDYGDEALRVLDRGREYLRELIRAQLRTVFAERDRPRGRVTVGV